MTMTSQNVRDAAFRGLFSLIFVGLGLEHLFSDELLQLLIPSWMPFPRLISIAAGGWLLTGGMLILLGWKVREAAAALSVFLVAVTLIVHLPGVLSTPVGVDQCENYWVILQRSNLAKNLCLLGVCIHLFDYRVGHFSLTALIAERRSKSS